MSGENQSGQRSKHSIRQTDCVYGIIFRPIPIDTQFIQSVTRNFESATRDQQRDYWTGGRTDVGRRPTDGSAMLTIQTCHGLTAGRQHI